MDYGAYAEQLANEFNYGFIIHDDYAPAMEDPWKDMMKKYEVVILSSKSMEKRVTVDVYGLRDIRAKYGNNIYVERMIDYDY